MADTVLLTGATGFLGMEVLTRLLEQTDSEVIVLVRARESESPAERMASVFAQLYDEVPRSLADRVTAVAGDVAVDGLGLGEADRQEILERASSIVHCAAAVAFDSPLEEAMNVNAGGTSRILSLGFELAERGSLRRIVHVSTAYVSGRHAGQFREQDLDLEQSYRNSYEISKAHGERIVRSSLDSLPIVVARPSIVVGDSHSGWTPAFNVIYWPLRAFWRGLIDTIPASPDGVLDIVPIDYVADGIVALHECEGVDGATVNLVAGAEAISNRDLLALACRHFERPLVKFAHDAALPRARQAETYLPYFDVETTFDDRDARRILAPRGLKPARIQSYFPTILDYACQAQWGKRPLTRETVRREAHERGAAGGLPSAADDRVPAVLPAD